MEAQTAESRIAELPVATAIPTETGYVEVRVNWS